MPILKNSQRLLRHEEYASRHINLLTHYDDTTLLDKNNRLIKIIKLSGLDYFTQSKQCLDAYKNRRHNLLKSIPSDFAIYTWEVRRKGLEHPEGEFLDNFAHELNESYQKKMSQQEIFYNEHYIALIAKQPEGAFNKVFNVFERLSASFDKAEKQRYLAKRQQELTDVARLVISALGDYKPKLLKAVTRDKCKLSMPLSFISTLVNGDSFSIPLEIKDAASILSRKRLFFNNKSGTIEIRSGEGKSRFAAMVSIKAYGPVTYQGILDGLGLLRMEYVMTQSFRPYDNQVAKGKMRNQQKDMHQSKDESVRQAEEIDEAFDTAASGEVGYGLHHFSFMCYADTQEALNKQVGIVLSHFSALDIAAVRETVACECTFWAQLPANFSYVARGAVISTKNMAAFASFHNYPRGKIADNYWGPAVSVFQTLAGSPYYFNFHYKDVGNFLVVGAMGSGKTVTVGFLIAQSMKFGGKRIIFDKDRGLEILVRALGGCYDILKPGKATGFNPCQLEDTPDNRKFLSALLKKMLMVNKEVLNAQENEVIEQAIAGMYRLKKSLRQLCHLASFFGTKKIGSLRARFDEWHSEGPHAWLFDHEKDTLNVNPNVIGFDLGNILGDSHCKTPALMYLTYRVEQALVGHRGLLFCDEGWLMLADDYFKELINNWSRTPRKKNNIFGLATQVANDASGSTLSKSLNESAFCKIIFPNPSADYNVHIHDFGLTEHEYQLIKTLPDDQHAFLLIHGRGTQRHSVPLVLNLQGLEKFIAVISARESSLQHLDEIRAQVGDNPRVWLPLLMQRLKIEESS